MLLNSYTVLIMNKHVAKGEWPLFEHKVFSELITNSICQFIEISSLTTTSSQCTKLGVNSTYSVGAAAVRFWCLYTVCDPAPGRLRCRIHGVLS